MSLFTSNRERRLWLWTLAVVVAIYSTLGLAGTLVGTLRHREDLYGLVFFIGMILIGATILTQGLKVRPRGAEIAVAMGVTAVYLFAIARLGIPAADRTHLMEYGVVAVFIYEALIERASQGRPVPRPALRAIAAASLLGTLDECIQAFLPNRVFDPIDIGFNFLAALTSVLASVVLRWVRRRGWRRGQAG